MMTTETVDKDPLGEADPLDGQEQPAEQEYAAQPQLTPEQERELRKKKRRENFGAEIAGMVALSSNMVESQVKIKGIALTEPEHDALAESVQDCADEYLGEMGYIPPWVDLALVSASIVVPRYMLISRVKAAQKGKENQEGGEHEEADE